MDIETQEALETLRADLHRMGERLEAAIRDGLADSRRYFDVLTESLRDDIRIIAEGVIALDAKVITLDAKVIALDAKVERFRPPDSRP